MTYATKGERSDVSVERHAKLGKFVCVGCSLPNVMIFDTPAQMLAHLDDHRAAGHKVPKAAVSRLIADTMVSWSIDAVPAEAILRARRHALSPGKGPMATAAERRPEDFLTLTMEARWAIDKELGILDWDGRPET